MKRTPPAQHLSNEQFKAQKRAMGHEVWRLSFYDGELLCTTIYADFSDRTLTAENHKETVLFGFSQSPHGKRRKRLNVPVRHITRPGRPRSTRCSRSLCSSWTLSASTPSMMGMAV